MSVYIGENRFYYGGKLLTWINKKCRLCKKFIKIKHGNERRVYCDKCYLKVKNLMDRGNNIFKANIRYYTKETLRDLILYKHYHIRGFL